MSPIDITAAAMVVEKVLILVGAWLGLRSRAQREEAYRRFVIEALHVLSQSGRICDQAADGVSHSMNPTSGRDERETDDG